ncbi:hypothetical protein JTE90_024834 [Oedothorax gibbosus]|uniref:G-protein coupled receptors family 1 profile domain-containing protein n=1 Tax=Oedothorax gibbosus TaxID=931172 RepID=A0AAV6U432_9ARAC|nr:hypothetical protein JTE90_024834 [Oedothorax gibbosus]
MSNDTKTVQVTVVLLYNGTYVVDSEKDPALHIVEVALLVAVLLISFVTNIFLLVTITSSYSLRRVPFNMLLANLALVFIFESLFNMTVALFQTCGWNIGVKGCALNSFWGQLVTLQVTFCLCVSCFESMASVWQPVRFQSYLTVLKQGICILTMWVVGVLLCVPFIFELIPSRVFVSRYSCASAGPGAFVHGIFLTLCYCLLILIGASCLLHFGIQQWKEHRQQKKRNTANYTDVFIQGDLWTEWVNFKLVSWLCLFYLVMELPYIVVHQISALRTYPLDSVSGNGTLPLTEITPRYETAFTWFRFLYSCLFTFVVFKMRKDIRTKFKALAQCCRGGIVRDHSAGPVTVKQDTKKTNKKNSLVPLSVNTPVLYISPDGLCLRQLAKKSKQSDLFSQKLASSQPKFVSYFCDLDSTISGDDFASSFSSSSSERRFSKESEVSLPYMDASMNLLSEEIPMKDMSTLKMEPVMIVKPIKPKKAVRFADTLTIFRSLTPRSPTPEWVVNVKNSKELKIGNGKASRIPIRKVDNISPWKVELNTTYRVNTPVKRLQRNNIVASDSKVVSVSGQKNNKARKKFREQNRYVRGRTISSPPRWKINKLI